jgi:hypothetical protein
MELLDQDVRVVLGALIIYAAFLDRRMDLRLYTMMIGSVIVMDEVSTCLLLISVSAPCATCVCLMVACRGDNKTNDTRISILTPFPSVTTHA